LHLVFIGDGPARASLEQFVRTTDVARYIHFVGLHADVSAWLAHSAMIWVPNRAAGGANVALEAMALGRPVVAARLPPLLEIVADGETGFLVKPGDKVSLARQARLLLDDPERGRQMGEAGRRRAEQNFAAASMIRSFAQLYEVCGS